VAVLGASVPEDTATAPVGAFAAGSVDVSSGGVGLLSFRIIEISYLITVVMMSPLFISCTETTLWAG
jgi:hypothetical protein